MHCHPSLSAGKLGPLSRDFCFLSLLVVAVVVVVGRGLAGLSAVQGATVELCCMGMLRRQRGDGVLHAAGVRGCL